MDSVTKKHVPERRCVGCAGHFPKSSLVRVIRTPEGKIALDFTGKMSGRGAYICRSTVCLEKARRKKRLESSLSSSISNEIYDRLKLELCGDND